MESELTKFLLEREVHYRRLEELLLRAEKGNIRKFQRGELLDFGHLYRMASADLARARYVLKSPILTEYLNELVGRAHHFIHRQRSPFWVGLWRYISVDFPNAVRSELMLVFISTVLILGAGLTGGISYYMDKDWGQLVMSQPELRQYEQSLQSGPSQLASGQITTTSMPAASAYIITNNIRACMVAAAGGLLFGLGTLMALIFNGFLLGVVGMMFLSRGPEYDLYFWSGILPHGVLEIPAIIIAGASGFVIARGLLIPGRHSRGDAVRREGQKAMSLFGGVIILLFLAGLIEGFVTPLKAAWFPSELKLVFAALVFTALMFYIALAGRRIEADSTGQEMRTTTHYRLE